MTGHKYRSVPGGIAADPGGGVLNPGSVLLAARIAAFYSTVLPANARGVLADLGCGTAPLRPAYEPLVTRAWLVDWPGTRHSSPMDVAADLSAGVPLRTGAVDLSLIHI